MEPIVDMKYVTPPLREAATRLLAHEVGGERGTSEHLAAASARLLDRLSEHLAQIIGRIGIEALWRRAVKLRTLDFPFLDERILSSENARPGEALRAYFLEQSPEVIREVSVALFATVAGLLVTVIGDSLAWSLLQGGWPDTLLREDDPQETQE
jgi:hypothetical protein